MTAQDRDALLPAIAAGDVQAFAVWLRHGEPRIRLSLKRFARAIDAEAVLQETLLRLWQVAPRVSVDEAGDALARLGVHIAHNLAVDHVRRERRLADQQRRALLALQSEPEPATTLGESDPLLQRQVRECVERLPTQPAAALQARIENQGGDADEALAARLGMQLNTFLKNFGRARKLLLECLAGRKVVL
jgi:DNA-directed RNA polymerase specialized sigma24 family protein